VAARERANATADRRYCAMTVMTNSLHPAQLLKLAVTKLWAEQTVD